MLGWSWCACVHTCHNVCTLASLATTNRRTTTPSPHPELDRVDGTTLALVDAAEELVAEAALADAGPAGDEDGGRERLLDALAEDGVEHG